MDDLDLNKISLDDFASENQDKSFEQTSSLSTPENTPQNFENRPRLRKIKRPKQHTGPISDRQTESSLQNNNSSSGQRAHNGLIRATDRAVNSQPDFNENYPTQNYPTTYVEDDYQDDNIDDENYGMQPVLNTKKLLMLLGGCFLIGLIFGKFFFSSEQVVQNGLQGVVVNPEVPKGRSRCGVAERTQGCVLYIMNSQRQELNGRDFYDFAVQLTGRQRFMIETGNMRYANVKIKPGAIAQLNIPQL